MEFMNNCCNSCGHDPCSCGGCGPAKYKCDFDIQANPYDPSIWNVTICGAMTKVKIPKMNETDTKLSTNYSDRTLTYNAEKHTDVIGGEQLGGIIKVEDLRDTDTKNANSCDLLVYNPYCSECGDGCKPKDARWVNYHIPDAGDCQMEPDASGNYKVLTKGDCGCIRECNLAIPPEETFVYYLRDSVPDDPDYPWYYGMYNDTINLYLSQNVSKWFGKYDLAITINYGIQVEHSSVSPNCNFRSLLCPQVAGDAIETCVNNYSSILQSQSTLLTTSPYIPWGSVSMRGSLSFIAPKGKEASLHHEFRLITYTSGQGGHPYYAYNPTYDQRKVPDSEAQGVDKMLYTASRLNALQVIVRPTIGTSNINPVKDTIRDTLDYPTDAVPNPAG